MDNRRPDRTRSRKDLEIFQAAKHTSQAKEAGAERGEKMFIVGKLNRS